MSVMPTSQSYPEHTVSVYANGLVSKNLHCVLNIVSLFQSCVGKMLTRSNLADGSGIDAIRALVHNLLIVMASSKVSAVCVCVVVCLQQQPCVYLP